MMLDCGDGPTYRLGHRYEPDAATRAMLGTGTVNASDCRCTCGESYVAHGVGSGYATDQHGKTMCYPHADEAEAAAFAAADSYTAYDSDNGKVTTWLGAELARVTARWIGRGGFGSRMVYLRAVAADGSRWYGRHSAEWGEAVTLHRSKGVAA